MRRIAGRERSDSSSTATADRMKRILAFVLLFALCLLGGCAKQPSYFVEFTLSQNAYSQGVKLSQSQLSELRGEVSELLHEIESQVSTKIEGSDLSRINAAAAGEEIEVGEHTAAMLEICSRLYERTGGAFSPALYNLSQLWGFTPEFEGKYSVPRPEPSAEAIADALADSSFADIEVHANVVVKHNGAVKLDLGGIAKGYMSDCVRELIGQKYPDYCGTFSVMSNAVLMGQKQEDTAGLGYTATLENPRAQVTGGASPNGALYFTGLSDTAVSTSADNYRFYVYGDTIYKHIIDPFTGKPSQNGVISITVLVPLSQENAGALADACSTAGFCMPLTDALEFYRSLWEECGIGAVILTSDFCYEVIGNYHVLQPKEYAALVRPELADSVENVFTLREVEATDTVVPDERVKEDISLFTEK